MKDKKTSTSKWIPRGIFFAMKKAGTLPPELQNYKSKGKKSKRKTKSAAKRSKRAWKKRVRRTTRRTKTKISKIEKEYTIFINGEERDTIKAFSALQAQKKAEKQYNTKRVLVSLSD